MTNELRPIRESIFLRFSYRPRDEGARSVRKTQRQILSRTDRTNEVNKLFIIWLLVHFFEYFYLYNNVIAVYIFIGCLP